MIYSQNRTQFKLISDVFVIFIISGSIFSYTSYSLFGQVTRLAGQFGIILFYVWRVDFAKYSFLLPILITFVLYPLFLCSIGIYSNLSQVLAYVTFFLWFLISLICVSECYKNNISGLFHLFYLTIIISLLLLFIFFRGISVNIFELLESIVSNHRYGGNISTARVSMGFQNVNQLGLFAAILIVFAIYFLINRKHIIFNLGVFFLSLILLLNSGSRTPIFALCAFVGIYCVYELNSVILKAFIKASIILIFLFSYLLFVYLIYFSKTDSSFFQLIDELFSFRISFSQEALELTSKLGNSMTGIGIMSSSYIQNTYTGDNFAIDSSIAYYLLTIGWIGSLGLNYSVAYLTYKINKLSYPILSSMFGFYISYAFFENVLFTPNSGLGIIVLSITFTYLRQDNASIK